MKMRKLLICGFSASLILACAIDAHARSSSSGSRSSSRSVSSSNMFSKGSSYSYKPAMTTRTYVAPVTSYKIDSKPVSYKTKPYVPEPVKINPVMPKKPSEKYYVSSQSLPKVVVRAPPVQAPVVVKKTTIVNHYHDRDRYHDNGASNLLTGVLVGTAIAQSASAQSQPQVVVPPQPTWPKFNFINDCKEWKCD